jgi:hypothetical protein
MVPRKGANRNVVLDRIVHFVAVLHIYTGASDIPQEIVFNQRSMGIVDNNTPSMRCLDGVSVKKTFGAVSKFVKMKAVLPKNRLSSNLQVLYTGMVLRGVSLTLPTAT